MFAKDLTGCFNHFCVEDGDHWIYGCVFIAHDGERFKPPAYDSVEGFQHVRIFQGSGQFPQSSESLEKFSNLEGLF